MKIIAYLCNYKREAYYSILLFYSKSMDNTKNKFVAESFLNFQWVNKNKILIML